MSMVKQSTARDQMFPWPVSNNRPRANNRGIRRKFTRHLHCLKQGFLQDTDVRGVAEKNGDILELREFKFEQFQAFPRGHCKQCSIPCGVNTPGGKRDPDVSQSLWFTGTGGITSSVSNETGDR